MARPITIGKTTYKTSTAARDAVRRFMASVEVGVPLVGDAAEFAAALLDRHPHREDKIGQGVDSFVVRVNRFVGRANRGLWITRVDGSEIDFSWVECLKASTHQHRVKNAMRSAVQDDVYGFKRNAFDGRSFVECALTGERVGFAEADVHHDPPFRDLVEDFVGGHYDCIEVDVGSESAQIGDRLVDESLRERWVAYHREKSRLYVASRKAHQALSR